MIYLSTLIYTIERKGGSGLSTNIYWEKNEQKKISKIIGLTLLIISGFSFLWLWYQSDIFSILLVGVGISVIIISFYLFFYKRMPRLVGISKKGIYFTEKKDEKIKRREIDKGILNNIAVLDAKINNFIHWSDIDGIKVEKAEKIFGRNCWIYLQNGVRVPINDLSSDIIKEIKANWEDILDEEG